MNVKHKYIIDLYIILFKIAFEFHEEFLWDKRNKDPLDIKFFASELIREKVLNEFNPSLYQKGISYITLDRLDFYSEYATKQILEKIYFYEKFHPEKFIQNGILCNNLFEFYIPININLTINNINCIENVNWDLLNVEMTPEIFAEILVNDENLNNDFIIPIAMQIRKEIHYFIYDLFKNISNNYEKYEQEKYLKETDKKTRKNHEESKNFA